MCCVRGIGHLGPGIAYGYGPLWARQETDGILCAGNYSFSETIRQLLPDGSSQAGNMRYACQHAQYLSPLAMLSRNVATQALQRQADPRRYPVRKTRVNFLYDRRYFQIDRFEEVCFRPRRQPLQFA